MERFFASLMVTRVTFTKNYSVLGVFKNQGSITEAQAKENGGPRLHPKIIINIIQEYSPQLLYPIEL